uniref:Glyco_transf_64 domain-containing protein n=1 Tax=Rhabditophanes sp. KR3021 TaxID=114890 RepID=A0AC35U9T4_9BILA
MRGNESDVLSVLYDELVDSYFYSNESECIKIVLGNNDSEDDERIVSLNLIGNNEIHITNKFNLIGKSYLYSFVKSNQESQHLESNKITNILDDFCLIPSESTEFTALIVEAITLDCIPVLLNSDKSKLPIISTLFDWSNAVIFVEPYLREHLILLEKFLFNKYLFDIDRIKKNGNNLMSFNMVNPTAVTDNLLEYLERIFVGYNKIRTIASKPLYPESRDEFYSAVRNNSKIVNKYTVIILTYHRESAALRLIQSLNNATDVDRILVIWNDPSNQRNSIPQYSYWANITNSVYFIHSTQNSLNNRFNPYDLIRTDGVLEIDDDQKYTTKQITYEFEAWKENKDVLVGYYSRLTGKNGSNKNKYITKTQKSYDLILTGHAFLHYKYLAIYTYKLHKLIRQHVFKQMNCEDLAMNFIVSVVSGKRNVRFLRGADLSSCPGCQKKGGVSSKKGHYQRRNDCVKMLVGSFGVNPLLESMFYQDVYN